MTISYTFEYNSYNLPNIEYIKDLIYKHTKLRDYNIIFISSDFNSNSDYFNLKILVDKSLSDIEEIRLLDAINKLVL
jgi:hypothetical protein